MSIARKLDSDSYFPELNNLFRCIKCDFDITSINKNMKSISCENCNKSYKVSSNTIDTLVDEKKEIKKESSPRYCSQSKVQFDQTLKLLGSIQGKRVLEIGAEHDHYLNCLKEKGADCYAINNQFDISRGQWFKKIIGNTEKLPFKNSCFDIIIISEPSSHTKVPEALIKEIYRVLGGNGKCLMINDWTRGIFGQVDKKRYSIWRYHRMFKRTGFSSQELFSSFYDQKLLNSESPSITNLSWFDHMIKICWSLPFMRTLLKRKTLFWIQVFFNFPINVILHKSTIDNYEFLMLKK